MRLHPGTIINPTGLTLSPGMVVSIIGYNSGSYFSANEIDTPYQFYSGYPYYAGHPWNYWGPSVTLGFFFGNPGWWHARYFGGGYHYHGGARVYGTIHVNEGYRAAGGTFHGHDVVAPREHGGYYGHPGGDGRLARPQGASRAAGAHENSGHGGAHAVGHEGGRESSGHGGAHEGGHEGGGHGGGHER